MRGNTDVFKCKLPEPIKNFHLNRTHYRPKGILYETEKEPWNTLMRMLFLCHNSDSQFYKIPVMKE